MGADQTCIRYPLAYDLFVRGERVDHCTSNSITAPASTAKRSRSLQLGIHGLCVADGALMTLIRSRSERGGMTQHEEIHHGSGLAASADRQDWSGDEN